MSTVVNVNGSVQVIEVAEDQYQIVVDTGTVQVIAAASGPAGPQGPAGQPGTPGVGVPAGGTTGQVLGKVSNADFDTTWIDQTGGGGSGTVTSVSVTTANGVSGTVANPTTTPAITLSLGAITPTSVAATGNVTGANLSGNNTGDQTITLSGDVSGSGTGPITTAIGAGKVTNSMLAGSITAAKLVGTDITTLGTITTGTWTGTTIDIAHGGTGQTTAPNAINALLPTQTGNNGKFLTTDGSVSSWANVPADTITTSTPTNLTGYLKGNGTNVSAVTTIPNTDITGLGTASTHATGDFLQTANNLSDLASASTARTNLGLGSLATQSSITTGTATNLVGILQGDGANVSGDFDVVAPNGATATPATAGTGISFTTGTGGTEAGTDGSGADAGDYIVTTGDGGNGGSDSGAGGDGGDYVITLGLGGTGPDEAGSNGKYRVIAGGTERLTVSDDLVTMTATVGISGNVSVTAAPGGIPLSLKAASGSARILDLLNASNFTVGRFYADGTYEPVHLADSSAANGTLYFSTTQGEYVFKNADGVVHSAGVPTQTGNSGKFLTTNGTVASWANVPPDTITGSTATTLTGYLKGNGSTLSAVTTIPNTDITGLGTASTHATGDFLQTANNLSDLANAGTARTNLGLGTAAVKNTGTSGNTVPLLDGANSWSASQTFLNSSGVKILDTDASNTLGLVGGSNLTADRTLTITTGDASRTLTFTGDATISGTNTGDQTITLTGDVTGSGTGSFATTIGANKVTNSMLATVSTATFKGRTTAGTGNVEDLTGTQATALLDVFTSSLKGLAPSSGGGTTNYLRADGTWAAPPGTATGTVTSVDTAAANNGVTATWTNTTTTPRLTVGLGNITPTSVAATGTGSFTVTDAATNTTPTVVSIGHNTSGTPAAGFGTVLVFAGQDSTTTNTEIGRITAKWADATHATRRGQVQIMPTFAGLTRTCVDCTVSSGGAAQVGFLAATPASQQSGDAGTALVTFGLMSGTPTFNAANVTNLTGFSAPATFTLSDAATNTVATVLTLDHESSGTPTLGFGTSLDFNLKSDTVANRKVGSVSMEWVTSADASRLPVGRIKSVSSSGTFESLSWSCSTVPAIGFLGSNPTTQQTGDVGTALTNFGLMSGTPTFNAANLTSVNSIIPAGTIWDFGGVTTPSGWLVCDGSAVSRTTYAALFSALVKSATITVTIASPAVVSWTAHGLLDGDPVVFTTTGALPTGITSGTTYYVKSPSTNSFNIAATPGGTAINTSGSQSGTHTGIYAPWGRGDGSTTFNVPDLRGRASIGSGTGSGLTARNMAATGGEETHLLTTGEMPSHTHSMFSNTDLVAIRNTSGGANTYPSGASPLVTLAATTGSAGGGGSHNNMQPFAVVSKIIKT